MKRILKIEEMTVNQWYILTPQHHKSADLSGIHKLTSKDNPTNGLQFLDRGWWSFNNFSSIFEVTEE